MEQEPCDTSLTLGLRPAVNAFIATSQRCAHEQKPPVQFHILFPTCVKEEQQVATEERGRGKMRLRMEEEDVAEAARNSRGGGNAKSGGVGGGSYSGDTRKKLRLTKEQSDLLENSFRERNTLTLV